MTGRELIIQIMESKTENVDFGDIFAIREIMTVEEAAEAYEVGTATVSVWVTIGIIDAIIKEGTMYILKPDQNPKELLNKRGD